MTSRSFCQTLSYEDTPGSVIRLLNELQGSSLEKSWKEVRLAAMYKPASRTTESCDDVTLLTYSFLFFLLWSFISAVIWLNTFS